MVDRKALKANLLTLALLKADPLAYAFEAMLINQFHGATTEDGNTLYYLINTTYWSYKFSSFIFLPLILVRCMEGESGLFIYSQTHQGGLSPHAALF